MHARFPDTFPAALRLLPALLLAVCLLVPSAALAQKLILDKLVLDNHAGAVTVRFGIHVDDISKIENELKNGGEMELRIKAMLSRRRTGWLAADLADKELVGALGYDPLTREFHVVRPGADKPVKGGELGPLMSRVWGDVSLELIPWESLERGKEYVLDFEMRLARTDVPGWIRTTLFFVSWDVIGVTTYRLDFTY